jgi:hypothetical protein
MFPDGNRYSHIGGPVAVDASGRFALDGVSTPSGITDNGLAQRQPTDIAGALAIHPEDDAKGIIILETGVRVLDTCVNFDRFTFVER